MEAKEKELIDGIVKVLKRTVQKEKDLTDVFRENSYVYNETIESLERLIFHRLGLVYGYDGTDDGNHKDGLFSYVIDETLTIWDLLQYKEEKRKIWNRYSKNEIDLDTYYELERQLDRQYEID